FWTVPTILSSFLVFVGLRDNNLHFYQNIIDRYWWMFLLSLICFLIASSLILLKRYYGVAFLFVMLQFFFAFFGYGAAHLP
ncbi:cytochrome D ubiquinol oxidase subunit II, partial [Pseudomonas sp. FW305-BF6]|uniref:hypothetical protein n=1 Tax=Pseudomonas sp. FW305-BF6 TaxID=2070673 RepID=UPI000CAB9234